MTTASRPDVLPELGPLLGRLVAPPGDKTPAEARLDAVRLDLLTELFDRAGAARGFLALGDETGAHAALGPAGWLEVWEHAVAGATSAVSGEIEQRLRDAAAVSRYPARRLAAALPAEEDRRRLAARLSAAGIGFEESVARLAETAPAWGESLRRVSGELEAAWDRLTSTAEHDLALWDRQAAEIRSWRRSWLPLLLAGGLLFTGALWLGLILGGYITAPGWLRPLTDWIWGL